METHGIGLGNFVANFVYPTFPMSFGYDTMTIIIGKPLPLGLLGAYKISSVINRHVGRGYVLGVWHVAPRTDVGLSLRGFAKFKKIQKNLDRAQIIQTFFGNPSLTWT